MIRANEGVRLGDVVFMKGAIPKTSSGKIQRCVCYLSDALGNFCSHKLINILRSKTKKLYIEGSLDYMLYLTQSLSFLFFTLTHRIHMCVVSCKLLAIKEGSSFKRPCSGDSSAFICCKITFMFYSNSLFRQLNLSRNKTGEVCSRWQQVSSQIVVYFRMACKHLRLKVMFSILPVPVRWHMCVLCGQY